MCHFCHRHHFLPHKDNASEGNENLFSNCRAQLILCKDNASERKESLLSVSRAQLILCKVKKKSRNGHCRPQNRFKRGAIPPKMQPRQAKPRPKRREMPTKTPQKSNRPKKTRKKFGGFRKTRYLCTRLRQVRALSSAGLEHLPYKQRVGGSNPSAPTQRGDRKVSSFRFHPRGWAPPPLPPPGGRPTHAQDAPHGRHAPRPGQEGAGGQAPRSPPPRRHAAHTALSRKCATKKRQLRICF